MPRGVKHSAELRAQVVAAILAGATVAETARRFGVSPSVAWRYAEAERGKIGTLKNTGTAAEVLDFQQLLLTYIGTALRAMIAEAEVLADPAYCRAQDADKLAIAHGIVGDKLAGIARTAQALGIPGTRAQLPDSDTASAEPAYLDGPALPDHASG